MRAATSFRACLGAALHALLLTAPAHAAWLADGTPVTLAPGDQLLTAVVPDGAGGIYVAWDELADGGGVFVQRLTASGEPATGWPAGGLALASTPHAHAPRLAADGVGGVFVAWTSDGPASTSSVQTNLNAQHLDPAATVHADWPALGVVVASGSTDLVQRTGWQIQVGEIAGDGSGGCVVSYQLLGFGCHDGFCNSSVGHQAQAVTAAGVTAQFLPLLWCPDGGDASGPVIADEAGGAFALLRTDCGPAMALVHSTAVGVTNTPLGPLGGAAPRALQGDDTGGVYALFPETGAGVVLRRLTAAGAPAAGWTASGLALPVDVNAAFAAVPDAAGGLAMCWRSAAGLRALRITADAQLAPSWPADGADVAGPPAVALDAVSAAEDGSGGLFVAWQDGRALGSTGVDLYATRILGDGTRAPDYPVAGLPLCRAAGLQDPPRIVATGPGTAIAVWQDWREGAFRDIYAQRLPLEIPVAVTASVVSTRWEGDEIVLEWELGGGATRATLQRSADAGPWQDVVGLDADGSHRLHWRETPGPDAGRVGYRLDLGSGVRAGETWVDVPRLALAVRGFVPNPARGAPIVELSVRGPEPATLELLDVAGRRVLTRTIAGRASGVLRVSLEPARPLAAGVYTLRLSQSGVERTARGLVAP